MNLYIRLFLLLLKRAFVLRPLDIFDACETHFRVNIMDLDLNLHMNNGRYLTIMDLGRFDLMLKAGVFWTLAKKGYYPVVSSESIRFKKSLEPFQIFTVTTAIESWNDKDFFMTQKFTRNGMVVAEGYVKGRFKQRKRKGSVPTSEVFELIGKPYDGPRLSELANSQIKVESCLAIKD